MKAELRQLQHILAQGEFSAPDLALHLRCSLPTVYRRLNALALAGVTIVVVRERRPSPGPTPRRFRLARLDRPMASRP